MHTRFQSFRWMAAAIALALFFTASAGPVLGSEGDDLRDKCAKTLKTLVFCAEILYADQPAIMVALIWQFLIGYEYCLKYADEGLF